MPWRSVALVSPLVLALVAGLVPILWPPHDEPDDDFYIAVTQVIPVLLVALIVEGRFAGLWRRPGAPGTGNLIVGFLGRKLNARANPAIDEEQPIPGSAIGCRPGAEVLPTSAASDVFGVTPGQIFQRVPSDTFVATMLRALERLLPAPLSLVAQSLAPALRGLLGSRHVSLRCSASRRQYACRVRQSTAAEHNAPPKCSFAVAGLGASSAPMSTSSAGIGTPPQSGTLRNRNRCSGGGGLKASSRVPHRSRPLARLASPSPRGSAGTQGRPSFCERPLRSPTDR